jgi:hypothetical protein
MGYNDGLKNIRLRILLVSLKIGKRNMERVGRMW